MNCEVSKVLLKCKLHISIELSLQDIIEPPGFDTVPIVHMDFNEDRLGLRSLRHFVDGVVYYLSRSTAWTCLGIERLDDWSFQ